MNLEHSKKFLCNNIIVCRAKFLLKWCEIYFNNIALKLLIKKLLITNLKKMAWHTVENIISKN